jgi:hypothetical protein
VNRLATLAALFAACACGAVRVAEREPPVDDATRARIARLGCGDTSAVAALPSQRDSSFVVVRGPAECAELLGWMARWMGERFERWGPAASRERGGGVARFLLLRAGPLLHVHAWYPPARPGEASIGEGIVYTIDLRRRGEGITGYSF